MNEALFIFAICACAGVTILVALMLRRKTIRAFTAVEETLEQMISGTFTNSTQLYEDTFSAKINARLMRLYEVMESQSRANHEQHTHLQELISDISHQVKTPIANIRMIQETLATDALPPDKRLIMQAQMETQVDKLDFLMEALVKSSRLETGAVTLMPKTAPVIETLAQAVSGVVPRAESKNIEIIVDCDGQISAAHDRKWTAEALFNILDNAVKYSLPDSSISIACEQWEIYIKIDITDNGPGIAEDEQAQVFGRFYRSSSMQQEEGIGIGLYLAREIINKQGGYIKLISSTGEETTFSIFLPNQ